MFVEMKKEEGMNAFECDAFINRARDDQDGLTFDEAMEVLRKTNNFANIKKVVKEINKYKTAEERLVFKEFVLSAVDGRETTPETFDGLYKLAVEGNYVAELLKAYSRAKVYKIKECNFVSKVFYPRRDTRMSSEDVVNVDRCIFDLSNFGDNADLEYLKFATESIFKNCKNVTFNGNGSPSPLKYMSFENVEKVVFDGDISSVEEIDVSCCDTVEFYRIESENYPNFKFKEGCSVTFHEYRVKNPDKIDLSAVSVLYLGGADLTNWDNWNVKGGKKIDCSYAGNLPKVLDLSGFDEVNLSYCDFSEVDKVIFKDGAKVNLANTRNLPANLDLSNLSEVNLNECDLLGLNSLQFRSGAYVHLSKASFDVKKVNFEDLGYVSLNEVDFSGLDELKFKDGAEVHINRGTNFPKKLDFSGVNVRSMTYCDFTGVEELTLGGGNRLNLTGSNNFPEKLDLSVLDNIVLLRTDLSNVKDLKFKKGIDIEFDETKLPEVLDLAGINYVKFIETDLSVVKEIDFTDVQKADFSKVVLFAEDFDASKVKTLKFKYCNMKNVKRLEFCEDSDVKFLYCDKLPKVIDVSKCEKFDIWGSGDSNQFLGNIGRIIFRDKAQKDSVSVFQVNKFSSEKEKLLQKLKIKMKCRYKNSGSTLSVTKAKQAEM